MTTIVMVQKEDDVVMGWDSRIHLGRHGYATLATEKVWSYGGVCYGMSGMAAIGDFMRTGDLPEYDEGDPDEWVLTKLMPALRERMKDTELGKQGDEPGIYDFSLLLAVGGRAYDVDGAFSASRYEEGLYAIGSGGDYALGALKAGTTVLRALEIAAECDSGTGGTLTVRSAKDMVRETENNRDDGDRHREFVIRVPAGLGGDGGTYELLVDGFPGNA